jgi:hypothetical protein
MTYREDDAYNQRSASGESASMTTTSDTAPVTIAMFLAAAPNTDAVRDQFCQALLINAPRDGRNLPNIVCGDSTPRCGRGIALSSSGALSWFPNSRIWPSLSPFQKFEIHASIVTTDRSSC